MTPKERANNYVRMWVERLRKLTPEELTKREDPKKGYPPPMEDYPNVVMWDYAPGGKPTRVYDFTLDDIIERLIKAGWDV